MTLRFRKASLASRFSRLLLLTGLAGLVLAQVPPDRCLVPPALRDPILQEFSGEQAFLHVQMLSANRDRQAGRISERVFRDDLPPRTGHAGRPVRRPGRLLPLARHVGRGGRRSLAGQARPEKDRQPQPGSDLARPGQHERRRRGRASSTSAPAAKRTTPARTSTARSSSAAARSGRSSAARSTSAARPGRSGRVRPASAATPPATRSTRSAGRASRPSRTRAGSASPCRCASSSSCADYSSGERRSSCGPMSGPRRIPGKMNVISAAIPGTDPAAGELLFVAHAYRDDHHARGQRQLHRRRRRSSRSAGPWPGSSATAPCPSRAGPSASFGATRSRARRPT